MKETLRPHAMPWASPLDLARGMPDDTLVLLYSSIQVADKGRFSWLACEPAETVTADTFDALAPHLSAGQPLLDNAWFGYLGYGLKDCLERLPPDPPGQFRLPHLWMSRFRHIYCFDHVTHELVCWSATPPKPHAATTQSHAAVSVTGLASNMRRQEYLSKVSAILRAIRAGDLYQANLTRKFSGRLERTPDTFALFERLSAASPSPCSAYLRLGGTAILSSSPECFLTMDAKGLVRTEPIKGTAPRGATPAQDAALRNHLETSAKDRAENLMIVDLMRNDLSRHCIPGSVKVERLFEITSHASVHHMSSTITGQKSTDAASLEMVKGCFPPGSMTGTPKIRAIQLCTELEQIERGVYSGTIGWFGGDGSADLSVVIRTLVVEGQQFEFQVGGGIVADSTPEGEWEETLDKAAGIAKALGITREQLAAL